MEQPALFEEVGQFYDMPDKVYRKASGLSVSAMKLLKKSPAHFKSNLDYPQPATEAMNFGTGLHEFLLGSHGEESRLVVRPDLQSPYTKEGKAWKADKIRLGQVVVSEEEMDNIYSMRQTLLSNDELAAVLGDRREVSMFMDTSWGGHSFRLKGRADLVPEASDALWDIKTCQDASNFQKIKWKIIDFGYDLQACHYLRLYNETRPPGTREKTRFIFIFVETQRPFGFRKVELDRQWMARAGEDFDWLIGLYVGCSVSGEWPGYEDRIHSLSYPGNRLEEAERELE